MIIIPLNRALNLSPGYLGQLSLLGLWGGGEQNTMFCYNLDYSDKAFCCTARTEYGWRLGRILSNIIGPKRNVNKPWLFFSFYSQKSRYLTSCNPTSTEGKDTRHYLLIFSLFFCLVISVAGEHSYLLPYHFIFGR